MASRDGELRELDSRLRLPSYPLSRLLGYSTNILYPQIRSLFILTPYHCRVELFWTQSRPQSVWRSVPAMPPKPSRKVLVFYNPYLVREILLTRAWIVICRHIPLTFVRGLVHPRRGQLARLPRTECPCQQIVDTLISLPLPMMTPRHFISMGWRLLKRRLRWHPLRK